MSHIFSDYALKYYENGYNILPIEPNSKRILLPNWQIHCETKQMRYQVEGWLDLYANHNIGTALGMASNIIGLDFDEDKDGLHEKVQALVAGSLVKKKGRKGYTAFYRYNGEHTKRWYKDKKPIVELLSTGTQTVLPPSIHPDTGQPYHWMTQDTLLDMKAEDLTTLPDDFIKQVDKIFGYEEKILNFQSHFKGELPELAEVEKAMSFIPSNDYATWITVGMALQHNYGDSAFPLWEAWSMKAPNYEAKGMQYKWNSFGKYKGRLVTIATIFHYAIGYGYIKENDFEQDGFKMLCGNVDLITGEVYPDEKPVSSILEFPKHLLDNAPGLPGEMAKWIDSTALKRQPVLALGAAICAAGTLFAHKIRNDSNLRTNFMILGLAESGAGKNHARSCIKSLFYKTGMEHLTAGNFASDAALINTIDANGGIGIALMDEIGREIAALTQRGAGGHEKRLITAMMEMYSEAGTYYDGKKYADSDNAKRIIQPCVNIYGTTVPKRFFDAMTSDEAIDGFIARWFVFESNDIDPPMQESGNIDNIPPTLMENIKFIQAMPTNAVVQPGYNIGPLVPQPTIIPYSSGAKDILDEFSKICNDKRLEEIKKGGLLAPIWSRAREHAIKLALVAHPYRDGIIETMTMGWACELAMYLSLKAIEVVNANVTDSPHQKMLYELRDCIKRWNDRNPGQYMPHTKLCNNFTKIKGRERNEMLQQLRESGMIDVEEEKESKKANPYSYKVI